MVTVSNIVTTEQVYQPSAAQNSGNGSSHSVFNKQQPSVDKTYIQEKFQELLLQYKDKGLTLEDLEKIRQNLGFDKINHETRTRESVDRFIKFLKQTIDSCIVDGKVDLKKLENSFKERKDTFDALNKGLVGLLIKRKYLDISKIPSGAKSASEIPQEVLQKAVEDFINDALSKLNSDKRNDRNIQRQQRIFQTLLAGTDDADKIVLWNAVKNVLAKNDMVKDAITDIIKSYENSDKFQEMLNQISSEDLKKLGIDNSDLLSAFKNAINSDDPNTLIKLMDGLKQLKEKFLADNSEIVKNCIAKIEEYEKLNPDKELTDEVLLKEAGLTQEELKIYRQHTNIKSIHAGTIIGCEENGLSCKKLVYDTYKIEKKYGVKYLEDISNEILNYADKHADELKCSPESIREFAKQLTSDEYVSSLTSESSSAQSESGVGLNNNTDFVPVDTRQLVAEFYEKNGTEENGKITVESNKKNSSNPLNSSNNHKSKFSIAGKSAEDICNNIGEGKAFKTTTEAVYHALKNFKDLTASAKEWVSSQLTSMSKTYKKYVFKKGLAGAVVRYLVSKKIIKKDEVNEIQGLSQITKESMNYEMAQ